MISKRQRCFNTTGTCNPVEHYMVNLDKRLAAVKVLVDEGKYFTINRARQFGKTTTLQALGEYLNHEYFVVSMDFQMQMSNAKYKTENRFSLAFAKAFVNSFKTNPNSRTPENEAAIKNFSDSYQSAPDEYELVELFQSLSTLCSDMNSNVVLIIDEVDSATNNQVFLDFLAQLRGYYLNRNRFSTFHSVILAGVCDIKNLKRNLRPEEEHKDNSPWNTHDGNEENENVFSFDDCPWGHRGQAPYDIAADFDIDMSFSAVEIMHMLEDYEADHHTGMNAKAMAQEIFDYTAGYPYLVSRLCQILEKQYTKATGKDVWSHEGLLDAVRTIVSETNSLFDDMAKKIKDFPDLRSLLYDILFCGKSIPYNPGTELVSVGTMFGFLKDDAGQVAISNRIFEIWLYNLFISEEAIENKTYNAGQKGKDQFIKNDSLDMKLILNKFVQHFTEVYGTSSETFVEENGRKLFLLYIRPLINGTGNYYIESRTRSMGRTDLIIDYSGKQYVIEMKIWHGEEYNKRGEDQLIGYLNDYNLKNGYMLSFNFNKNKQPGVKELHFKNHSIIEAIV